GNSTGLSYFESKSLAAGAFLVLARSPLPSLFGLFSAAPQANPRRRLHAPTSMAMLDDRRHPFRDAYERFSEGCYVSFPCLADPARRSSLCLKAALLFLHVIIVGFLFVFYRDLTHSTQKMPWYPFSSPRIFELLSTVMYLVLFVVTLVQYFFTSGSSPGYVLDAMKGGNKVYATFSALSRTP
ncbi:hypothetical protein Taro_048194, partial [Colocasia esculenta]|nr:hypothetical protein [Colocasia esculenta]